ncbi:MAG: NADH-quinone oxidoreductase subunit J [Pseudomonadota bacterium]|nr:NADH-quinone oxidoreductase subunit J [Pseudomonadota bacterium]
MMDSAPLVFYTLAALITFSSIMVVAARTPVISALFLVLDLFLLACVYASLNANFVAVIQVLVYAGAILVLFLFVIMMLNVPRVRSKPRIKALDGLLITMVMVAFLYMLYRVIAQYLSPLPVESAGGSNTEAVGKLLFVEHLWAFELASFLILLAMVASIVITKKRAAP